MTDRVDANGAPQRKGRMVFLLVVSCVLCVGIITGIVLLVEALL